MRFGVLGPLQVFDRDGVAVQIRGVKVRTLLTMLVLRAGEPVTTDQLSDALWGDDAPMGATNALQTHVSRLRRSLEPGMLDSGGASYSLSLHGCAVDAVEFSELAATGRELLARGQSDEAVTVLRRALGLWRGEALCDVDDADFAIADRVRLSESRAAAREDLLDAELAAGETDAVVAAAEALLAEHPMRERVWATLMLAQYRSGRQADALRSFRRARDLLAEELGLDPGPALRDLERRILEQDPTLLAAPRPSAATPSLTNLHPALSTFVGRANDIRAVTTAFVERRLVTLTGPGGVGKTRLATEVALSSSTSWPDGAWFVDLGTESGEGAIDRALRRTFGPRLGHVQGDTIEWLSAGLASAHVLIVFDNCEHVINEAAPLVQALLHACGGVRVLATSREPLGCSGELVRRLEPLTIDDAVELFRSRAADSTSEVIDHAEDGAVRSICAQIDRLPLAIELTAARVRVFTVAQLDALLHQRSNVVSTDSNARPPRQQTLESAVMWSYDLLFDGERRLLDRLSVFAGGFTLAAACAVCSDTSLPTQDIELMLARLVDKSLVSPVARSRPSPRFDLLRPVAEFAQARLDGAGDTERFRNRHATWLVELTEPVREGMRGRDALHWAGVVAAEMANLTRGAQWLLERGDPADGLRIAVNLGWYAFLSANIHDDHPLLIGLLDRAAGCEPPLVCRAMSLTALLSIGHTSGRTWAMDAMDVTRAAAGRRPDRSGADQAAALAMTNDAIALARTLDDADLLIEVLVTGALHVAAIGTEPDLVDQLTAELRTLADAVGARWHLAVASGLVGLAAYVRDDLTSATIAYRRCIDDLRLLGDEGTAAVFEISAAETVEFLGDIDGAIASVTSAYEYSVAAGFRSSAILRSVLCWLTARNGDVQRSLALGREGLAAVHQPFNPVIRAQALFALGIAELGAGLLQPARDHVAEALAIHELVGMERESAMDHRALGEIAAERGDHAESLRRHSRAVELAVRVGLPWTIMLAVNGLSEAVAVDDVAEGCALVGAAEQIRDAHGYVDTPAEHRRRALLLERCADQIGGDAVEHARDRGRTVALEALLAATAM